MAGMGPPPKHPSQKRRPSSGKSLSPLPADGRKGKTPPWPFETQDARERKLWSDLWHTPQAVAWERTHSHREVAAYVRWSIAAEDGNSKAAAEARQLADRLALTPLMLMRAGYEIVDTGTPETIADVVTVSPRARLRAVKSA